MFLPILQIELTQFFETDNQQFLRILLPSCFDEVEWSLVFLHQGSPTIVGQGRVLGGLQTEHGEYRFSASSKEIGTELFDR